MPIYPQVDVSVCACAGRSWLFSPLPFWHWQIGDRHGFPKANNTKVQCQYWCGLVHYPSSSIWLCRNTFDACGKKLQLQWSCKMGVMHNSNVLFLKGREYANSLCIHLLTVSAHPSAGHSGWSSTQWTLCKKHDSAPPRGVYENVSFLYSLIAVSLRSLRFHIIWAAFLF